ncbi:MAG: TlyA family RNA methyltransferase [Bacteroidales bacterium]|nr:TlyA family RNA methyltransferase [Bacteroidales bacterium]
MRLDKLLVERNIFSSRERAQDAILQKTVKVDGTIVVKPAKETNEDAAIEVIDIFNKYVSRGGLKLEKAIEDFDLHFQGKSVLDIGASTGGFTDCCLKNGASFVAAVDVGSNQIHPSLLNHPSVLSLENKDFRELTLDEVGGQPFDFIVSDVSFISLTYLFPYFSTFLKPDGKMMLLIKPQFEAGASFLNNSGIVTSEKGYKLAIQRVEKEAINCHFALLGLTMSTLYEKVKNVEFLALFEKDQGNRNYKINYEQLFEEVKRKKKSI